MSDIADRLVGCFQTVFPFLTEDEVRRASKNQLDSWDSLAGISLLTVVEEEFDVQFDDDEADRLTTFDAVVDAVTARVDA